MREPPVDLAIGVLGAALRGQYGLDLASLTFLPLGHDSSAWVYRADEVAGRRYFVKVRAGQLHRASLLVPHYRHDNGVARVCAPLLTTAGELSGVTGRYALIVYPFIDGASGMARRLSGEQWRAFGATLRQIHDMSVPPSLKAALSREQFAPSWVATVRQIDLLVDANLYGDPFAEEFANFWRARREMICTLVERAKACGQQLARRATAFALCHADLHTGNLLVGDDGQLWIVDWDEVLLAPPERDLMFIIGGISAALVTPDETRHFQRGYGQRAIGPLAIAYYRYAWAVGDIASFGEQAFLRPEFGELTRRAGLESFRSLFEPGEIVAIALGSSWP
jgi:spectinomycin phosphotransferase